MTVRQIIKVFVKNSKMEKTSYIFLAFVREESVKLVFARMSLPGINAKSFRVERNHRRTGSKQEKANPRMMQYFWQLAADNKDAIKFIQ